jgi:hypothetical protein
MTGYQIAIQAFTISPDFNDSGVASLLATAAVRLGYRKKKFNEPSHLILLSFPPIGFYLKVTTDSSVSGSSSAQIKSAIAPI